MLDWTRLRPELGRLACGLGVWARASLQPGPRPARKLGPQPDEPTFAADWLPTTTNSQPTLSALSLQCPGLPQASLLVRSPHHNSGGALQVQCPLSRPTTARASASTVPDPNPTGPIICDTSKLNLTPKNQVQTNSQSTQSRPPVGVPCFCRPPHGPPRYTGLLLGCVYAAPYLLSAIALLICN